MQPSGIVHGGRHHAARISWRGPVLPLLARFVGKFVLDILPAALASVIGGFLFTQYQFGHPARTASATEQVTPASAEMMALVRDEHAMIMDYLKTQMAAEQNRDVAEDAASARAAADAKAAADSAADSQRRTPRVHPRRRSGARRLLSRRRPTPRRRGRSSGGPSAPLVIAQADPRIRMTCARRPDRARSEFASRQDARHQGSRGRRHAHVVSAIGDVFGSVGERIGGPHRARGSSARLREPRFAAIGRGRNSSCGGAQRCA